MATLLKPEENPFVRRALGMRERDVLLEALDERRYARLVLGEGQIRELCLCVMGAACPRGYQGTRCPMCVVVDESRGVRGVHEAMRRWRMGN